MEIKLAIACIIIVAVITTLIVFYVFRKSKLLNKIIVILFILVIMGGSFYINYQCDHKLYKATFNMYAIFFAIDIDVDYLKETLELPYYFVKTLAIISTFYMVVFGLFNSLHKTINAIEGAIMPNDYILYFTDDSNREFIENHRDKNLLEIEDSNNLFCGKKYLIAYSDDRKNLNFYAKNKEKLSGKKVAVMINDIESSLFTEDGYHVVNIYERIAQDFWVNRVNLFDIVKPNRETVICLIGLDSIGSNILKFGLLNNIYNVNQKIIYRVWGDKNIFDTLDINLAETSNDVMYYMGNVLESLSDDSIQAINNSHMCIISKWDNLIIQEVVSRGYKCRSLWIYDEDEGLKNTSSMFVDVALDYNNKNGKDNNDNVNNNNATKVKNRSVQFFGKLKIDNEMLFESETIESAKKKHHSYINNPEITKDELWKTVDIYSKKSSIAAAQYDAIRQKYPCEFKIEEEKELEHMRWCRFMLMDDWKYGVVPEGTTKDAKNKLHKDLVKYNCLNDNEKRKDEAVLK